MFFGIFIHIQKEVFFFINIFIVFLIQHIYNFHFKVFFFSIQFELNFSDQDVQRKISSKLVTIEIIFFKRIKK